MAVTPTTMARTIAFQRQAQEINAKLRTYGQRRSHGYRGPLTRADLARQAAQAPRNGHKR